MFLNHRNYSSVIKREKIDSTNTTDTVTVKKEKIDSTNTTDTVTVKKEKSHSPPKTTVEFFKKESKRLKRLHLSSMKHKSKYIESKYTKIQNNSDEELKLDEEDKSDEEWKPDEKDKSNEGGIVNLLEFYPENIQTFMESDDTTKNSTVQDDGGSPFSFSQAQPLPSRTSVRKMEEFMDEVKQVQEKKDEESTHKIIESVSVTKHYFIYIISY